MAARPRTGKVGTGKLMTAIRVAGLRKLFGGAPAVDDVSFEVESGSILTLLGPSGCGKTTTLRMIAGLERPDAGEVRVGDRRRDLRRAGVTCRPTSGAWAWCSSPTPSGRT